MRSAIRPKGSSCLFLKQLPLPADLRLDARRDRTHTAAGPSWLKTLSPGKCHTCSGSPALTRAGVGWWWQGEMLWMSVWALKWHKPFKSRLFIASPSDLGQKRDSTLVPPVSVMWLLVKSEGQKQKTWQALTKKKQTHPVWKSEFLQFSVESTGARTLKVNCWIGHVCWVRLFPCRKCLKLVNWLKQGN